MFLYCKSHLRTGGSVPEAETLEPIHVDGEHCQVMTVSARACAKVLIAIGGPILQEANQGSKATLTTDIAVRLGRVPAVQRGRI